MTSHFLNCTICPKKPTFSDVSHLLTHIGSKGHLAHLHSLQVRSHQEIGAGQKLTAYNQWYSDHGLAALLSDRMQQKEQKQADKKAANRRRQVATSSCDKHKVRKFNKKRADPVVTSSYSPEEQVPGTNMRGPADPAVSHYPAITSSPPRNHIGPREDDDEFVDSDFEMAAKGSPGSPKLKGAHWPGMALFDAAPEDLRRRRNQRKDSSVVQKLERNASLVQPTETVHSAVGMILKHRHMDNMEDDSPVEGEEPIVEPTPKKRKTGVLRARRQPSNSSNLQVEKPRRKRLVTPIKRSGSPASKKSRGPFLSSPPEKGSDDFKPTFRKIDRKRRKRTTFTIFEDLSPSLVVDGSHEEVQSAYVDTNTIQPQLAFRPIPLLRHLAEPYDPFKVIREQSPTAISGFHEICQGKENYPDFFTGPDLGRPARATINPLFFLGDSRYTINADLVDESQPDVEMTTHTNPFRIDNAFVPTRNPLMLSMQELNESRAIQGEFGFDDARSQQPGMLFAP